MFSLHAHNFMDFGVFFACTEMSVANATPKYKYASEERVASLEQDRPSGRYSASLMND